MRITILIYAVFLFVFSCKFEPEAEKKSLDKNLVTSALKELLDKKLKFCSKGEDEPSTIDSEFSNIRHIFTRHPKSTVVRAYKGRGGYFGLMHVKLNNAFESRLPEAIIKELKHHDLYQKNAVDLFFIVQKNFFAKNDFVRLLPHAWADPDVPESFNGDRLKRNFLFGLYDAEAELAAQVPIGSQASFEVYVHDGAFSPPNQGQIIIRPKISYAFYSLIIGEIYPSNEKRANVTLHWVLNHDDSDLFNNIIKKKIFTDASGKKVEMLYSYNELVLHPDGGYMRKVLGLDSNSIEEAKFVGLDLSMRDFLAAINQSAYFRATPNLQKLNELLGYKKNN